MLKKNKLFIIFSTADWDSKYLTNKEHVSKTLAKLGHNVLYIESFGLRKPSLKNLKDWYRIFSKIKKVFFSITKNSIFVSKKINFISPLIIPYSYNYKFIHKLNDFIMILLISRFIKRNQFHKNQIIVWTYQPYILNIIKKIPFYKLIYHCVDDLSSVPRINKIDFNDKQNDLIKKADKIFVTSENLISKLNINKSKIFYHSNVTDFDFFSKKTKINKKIFTVGSPRVVFHGKLSSYKINYLLLFNVIKTLKTYNFIIIGNENETENNTLLDKILKLNNVYFQDHVNYSNLPSFLQHCDVGIIPMNINNYTNSMFPMKYYEYVSSGLPVVSTRLKFTENLKHKRLSIANNTNDFIFHIIKEYKLGRLSINSSKKIVNDNTWDKRTKKMLRIINE